MEYSLWNLPPGLWPSNQGAIPLDSVPRPYYASATLPILPAAVDDGDLSHYGAATTNTTVFRPPDFLPAKNIFSGRPSIAHCGDDKAQLESMLQIGELMEGASNDSGQLSLASPPLMTDQRRQKRRGSDNYDLQSDEATQPLGDYARQQSYQHPMYGMLLSQMAACKQEESALSEEDEDNCTPVEPPRTLTSTSDYMENDSVTDRSAGSSRAGYECGDCGLVADTEAALKRHMAQAHTQPESSADGSKVSSSPAAVCPIESCHFRTTDSAQMESHVSRHVTDGIHPNTKKVKVSPSLQRVRYEREEYRCQLCSYSCTIEKAYQKHLKIHSMGVPAPIKISCVICGKDRPTEVDMNKHMKKHRDDRYFCCDICIFRTVQLKKLVQHRRMHTGEKPHLCPHCSYRSARRDNLRSHVRRVHKKENLYCDTFSPRSVLMSARPSALEQDNLPAKTSPSPSN